MMPTTTPLSDIFSASGQISISDIAAIAQAGFKTIVNNRPDGEGGNEQPTTAELEKEAQKHGIAFFYVPIVPGQFTQDKVDAMVQILQTAAIPIFGFCRSGARTNNLYQLATQHINRH